MVYLYLTDNFPLSLLLACLSSIFAGVATQDQIKPDVNPSTLDFTNSTANNIQPEVDSQFCTKCYGRSICINENGISKCYCPPDHYGEFCELLVQELPKTCTKTQCENGGICEQGLNGTFCICPSNYVGTNCSRTAVWIEVEMNLYKNELPINWNLADKTVPEIRNAGCNKLIVSNLRGPDPFLASSIIDCNIRKYEKVQLDATEGIRVNVLLRYDPGYNEGKFVASNVRRQLELAPDFGDSIGVNFKMDKTIKITNFDVCESNMHDCSPSAKCISDGVGYSCKCNRFYADGGEPGKTLPGRDCYHSFSSGFFLGCSVIVPILVAALVALFYFRRYKAQKAWISPSTHDLDSMQLVSSQHPKYSA